MTSTMSPPPVGSVVTTVPKTLTRRPTLVRKRDEDSDDEKSPPSPGKKSRVSFNQAVDVHTIGETASYLIQEEVRLAFDKRGWSDDSDYDRIRELYNSKKDLGEEVSSNTLKSYTAALLNNIVRLNRTSSDLVHSVINSQWLGRQEDYVTLFTKLLGGIVVQHGMYLGEVVRMLVENLTSGEIHVYGI